MISEWSNEIIIWSGHENANGILVIVWEKDRKGRSIVGSEGYREKS